MRFYEYTRLYKRLNSVEDIPSLASEFRLPENTLRGILGQKIVRSATARYYKIKHRSYELLQDWIRGKSFVEISKELNFPPVLTSSLILHQYGLSKRRFWKYLLNLELVKEVRVKKELYEVCEKDWLYSPEALKEQRRRGEEVEIYLKKWLKRIGLRFERQEELKKRYRKTPDFLLKSFFKVDNQKINWIECKASFGDVVEFRKNAKKQFLPYRKQFGSGLVIYWQGYLEDLRPIRKVIIKDRNFFVK